nr:hypothetical protein [Paraburkholderia aromaticivorans]
MLPTPYPRELEQSRYDGKANAKAASAGGDRSAALREQLENMRQQHRRNSGSIVFDSDDDVASLGKHGHAYIAVHRRVFHRVMQQVTDSLRQAFWIAFNAQCPVWNRHGKSLIFCRGGRCRDLATVSKQGRDFELELVEPKRALIDSGCIHQVLREPCDSTDLPIDHISRSISGRSADALRINWLAIRNGINGARNSCATMARTSLLSAGASMRWPAAHASATKPLSAARQPRFIIASVTIRPFNAEPPEDGSVDAR